MRRGAVVLSFVLIVSALGGLIHIGSTNVRGSTYVSGLIGTDTTWDFTVDIPFSDTTPPTITNLHPLNSSVMNDNLPTISAEYSDSSGINMSSVLLKITGTNVTSSATVTSSGVTYTPASALADGSHTVYLEVEDTAGNLATASWSFNIDSKPPLIIDVYSQPSSGSTKSDGSPTIIVAYSDPSGIDTSSVVLRVDGLNVTSSATVTAYAVTYTPPAALNDGLHVVYLEVKDVNGNLAETSWLFTVDTTAPPSAGEPVPAKIPWWLISLVILIVLLLLYYLVEAGKMKPEDGAREEVKKEPLSEDQQEPQ